MTASKGLRFSDLIFKPEWEYHPEKDVLYRIGCIPGKLLYTAIHGSPTTTESVSEACILLEKVMKENRLINIPYMIADYSKAGETSIHIRQAYAKEIRRITIETENSNVIQFIAGANTFNKIAIRIFSAFIRRKIIFVSTAEEAFQKIDDFSSFDLDSSDSITVRKSDLDEISHFFGTMLLNQDYYPDQKKVSKENPLSYLAESLELIKLDLEELKENEKRIEQQRLTESETARLALAESEKKYALLAQSARELLNFTTTQQMYEYTASKLHEMLEEQAIVAIVQYDQSCNRWKMNAIKGLGEKSLAASKLLGFDVEKLEGDILPEYNEALMCGKLIDIDIDFGKFFANTLTKAIENGIKKLFSIEKVYCIALQENQQIYGNITLIPRNDLQINREVIEAFTAQASAFLNRIKATEALNEAREVAEKASAAKNEFLAVVSHELRTPLNGVIGFTELLLNGKLTPEQRQYVQLANLSGHNLLKIIEDILNLTTIESAAFELENEKTDIIELIQQSYDIIKPTADKKGLRFQLMLEEDLPQYVMYRQRKVYSNSL